ncbi:MAG: hypothetical protein LBE79_01660, partial [Tannerella sp.]|jgi:hypothetical protein|nr:hypothetical protein [Tannerella sp.]
LTGSLLRSRFNFFFDSQLAAFSETPNLIIAAYSCFVLGNVFMCQAVITLVRLVDTKNPSWAIWGGVLVIFGLFARTYHGGIDHLAFQLVAVQDLETATEIIGKSYGAFHIMRYFNFAILFGWIVLAIGVYRSRIIGWIRSIALGSMALLPLGTLKGTKIESIICTAALCIALIPLGIEVLRKCSRPNRRTLTWMTLFFILIIIIVVLETFGYL